MADGGNIILIDDDKDLRAGKRSRTLELAGFSVSAFSSARTALGDMSVDFNGAVITDIRMPDIDGLELFARLSRMDADLPVILVTGHGDIPMAVQAIQAGAYEFYCQAVCCRQAGAKRPARRGKSAGWSWKTGRCGSQRRPPATACPLIGQTPAMESLRQTLRYIADTDVDVLVAGETGSGKEVVAQLLHNWSRRRSGNFVALNCGALPETVIESELFGHEAGAFTGAQKRRIGRIEHAGGGTLFLDEIESMLPATQVKMLRVLEGRARSIRWGRTRSGRSICGWLPPPKSISGDPAMRGDFREDLYYRLNVVTLSIPPLRERREDIPLLFSHFAARAAERFKRDIPVISRSVQQYLSTHAWPGNVRELSHFAERVVLGVEAAGWQATPSHFHPKQPAGKAGAV